MCKANRVNRRCWLARAGVRGLLALLGGTVLMPTRVGAYTHDPTPPELAALTGVTLKGVVPFRVLGLLVYDLSLWAWPGFELSQYNQQSFALSLRYARALEGQAIAERSLRLMMDLEAVESARQKAWLALMVQAFPNVVANDRITGAHDGKGGVRFWHNGRLTAQTQDPPFARLFFGIWLSPKTSAPALRDSLLKASFTQG